MSGEITSIPTARAPRERALLQAVITFAQGAMTIHAMVVQISDTGAKIRLDNELAIPERFQITIPSRNLDTRARLVWRQKGHAGIAFERGSQTRTGGESGADLRERVEQLERENAALKAELARAKDAIRKLSASY